MVGPFFYIDSKELGYKGFVSHLVSEEKAEKYGDFMTSPIGHAELFDSKFKNQNTDIEYFDFPRGRVTYNFVAKRHIIYIDACIRNFAEKIADTYMLKDYDVMSDEHYVCPGCRDDAAQDVLW